MKCRGTLVIHGNTYPCDWDMPHTGIAHYNKEARAAWCSDGEARRYGKKKTVTATWG